MKRHYYLLLILLISSYPSYAQNGKPKLLLRADDIGMNHAVNMAIQQFAETGIPFSTSVMFACPWYQESVAILKKYPAISVGVHLTLNSEWRHYRWGPVLGREAVPSLVDSVGYFYPSTTAFLASGYVLDEVERELSAQVERALASGLVIDYVDYHMGTAVSTPELRAVVEKIAKKYNLGISMYFAETYKSMFDIPVEKKKKVFLEYVKNLPPGKTSLVVLHLAKSTPEMNAMVDMNNPVMTSKQGVSLVSKHRQTELDMVCDKEFLELAGKAFDLVTYSDLLETIGVGNMEQPK